MRTIKTLEGISDGHLYDSESIVKVDARGCYGCSKCCYDVGDLVSLNPLDSYVMTKGIGETFDNLLKKGKVVLKETNKVQLPYLGMKKDGACGFLNEKGRCIIHSSRPSICRLFPLGRVYNQTSFDYFVQIGNCTIDDLGEVKVKDWIGKAEHETFIMSWYQLIKAFTFKLKFVYDEKEQEMLNKQFIECFYLSGVQSEEDFYEKYFNKLPTIKKQLGIL